MPRPSPPSVGAEAPRAAEPIAPAECRPQCSSNVVGSHGQYVPTLTAAAAVNQTQPPTRQDALTPR